jgi:predicted DNA-binding transcriptional regulator AlpA
MKTDTINTDTLIDTNTPPDTPPAPDDADGWLVDSLARLPAGTLLDECQLAALLGCHRMSIKRGVQRGELPAPVRLLGRSTWTAGRLIQYIDARLDAAEADAERERARIARLGA